MTTRQSLWQQEHAEAGLCGKCSRPLFKAGRCFRHSLTTALARRGILTLAKRNRTKFERFAAGMQARYERIVKDEGFAVDALREPEVVVDLVGFVWATGRERKKLLEVIAKFDDLAIRERFRGTA